MKPAEHDSLFSLEENCKDHAAFMYARLADNESEDISGHALMLTASSMTQIIEQPNKYYHQAPNIAIPDLNTILAGSRYFNRNGEVTPVMAAHMIAEDPRYSLLSRDDFEALQAELKTKSRCYG